MEAKFISAKGDTVQLLAKNGASLSVNREKISAADWKWIESKAWKAGDESPLPKWATAPR